MDYHQRPLLLVIFGITGDLSHRKILPALYRLLERDELPEKFSVVGITRQEYTVERLYEDFSQRYGSDCQHGIVQKLKDATSLQTLDMSSLQSFIALQKNLESISAQLGQATQRIYYLSIPAQAFIEVIDSLGQSGHNTAFANETESPKLLIEKPFGYDLASAKALVDAATAHFSEEQLYRIDHYLAKETAQNILTFRFNNPLFQTIWNAKHIDRISITAYESIGIEGRANFYEQTGALRDVVQSHLLQLLALITMEQPGTLDSSGIRRAKRRLLDAVTPVAQGAVATQTVRAQYDGYKSEVNNQDSLTETFARLYLEIDNEQWRGTRIEVAAGKALAERRSQIAVHFRAAHEQPGSNTLTFRLQPSEGITLTLEAKTPGLGNETEVVDMTFDYATAFDTQNAEAYERVIVDALRGDQSLFLSSEEVLTCWQIVENVIQEWHSSPQNLISYAQGAEPAEIQHTPK